MRRALLSGSLLNVGLGVVLVCAAACGGGNATKAAAGDDDSADSGHIDNCTLVTDAEASALGGHELKHDEDSLLGCPYKSVRPGSVNGELTVLGYRGKGAAKDHLSASGSSTVQDIPGVGDSAAALVRDGHINFLVVQKGNRAVKFVTTFISEMEPGSAKLKEAEALALKAIDRIK
jgi:hypothetical protein